MNYVMRCVFTEAYADPDNREKLLLWVVHLPYITKSFKKALIPLCGKHDFREARRHIHYDLEAHDSILLDIIDYLSESPFDWVEKYFTERNPDEQAAAAIMNVIKSRADRLMCLNPDDFITMMNNCFNERVSVIEHMKNDAIREYYIYRLLISEHANDVADRFVSAAPFICAHFPKSMLHLVTSIDIPDSNKQLLDICKRHNLIECCAVLCKRLHDSANLLEYTKKLILSRNTNTKLIEDSIIAIFKEHTDSHMSLIEEFIQTHLIVLAHADSITPDCCYSLKCAVEVASQYIDDEAAMTACEKMLSPLGRDKYERVYNNLIQNRMVQEAELLELKQKITEILGDSEETQSKLNNVRCAMCHLHLMDADTPIMLLECGHGVHSTTYCRKMYPRCPICSPIH